MFREEVTDFRLRERLRSQSLGVVSGKERIFEVPGDGEHHEQLVLAFGLLGRCVQIALPLEGRAVGTIRLRGQEFMLSFSLLAGILLPVKSRSTNMVQPRSCHLAMSAVLMGSVVWSATRLASAGSPPRTRDGERPQDKQITNSIGMRRVLIPAGDFLMGSHESAAKIIAAFKEQNLIPRWYEDEFPQHRVRITKPFYLGVHEVTLSNFREFVQATGYKTESESDGLGGYGYNAKASSIEGHKPEYDWRNVGWDQSDEYPVVNVTWNDSVAFCEWLSRKEEKKYRLPTEAEWEYACRAGTTTRFWSGNDGASLHGVANILDASAKPKIRPTSSNTIFQPWNDRYPFASPVSRFKANNFGLHDMHGNVWEWCSDWHGKDYYQESPQDDPLGPATGTHRVVRGGCWSDGPFDCRSSNRSGGMPNERRAGLGFRVAMEKE